jgi:hypothetical protein
VELITMQVAALVVAALELMEQKAMAVVVLQVLRELPILVAAVAALKMVVALCLLAVAV